MEIFNVEFIFCSPCFMNSIEESICSHREKENIAHFSGFVCRHNRQKSHIVETFVTEKIFLFTFFRHLTDIFLFDVHLCTQYNKRTFFNL